MLRLLDKDMGVLAASQAYLGQHFQGDMLLC